jgi:hypothetical protein
MHFISVKVVCNIQWNYLIYALFCYSIYLILFFLGGTLVTYLKILFGNVKKHNFLRITLQLTYFLEINGESGFANSFRRCLSASFKALSAGTGALSAGIDHLSAEFTILSAKFTLFQKITTNFLHVLSDIQKRTTIF